MPAPPARRTAWLLWPLLLAAAVYLALMLGASRESLIQLLERVPAWFAPAVAGLVFSGFLLRFVKWQWLMRRAGYRIPEGPSLRIFLAGLSMAVTPGRAGESVKALFLKRRFQVPASTTMATVLVERLLDLVSVLLVIGAMLGLGTSVPAGLGTAVLVSIGVILLVLAAVTRASASARARFFRLAGRRRRLRGALAAIDRVLTASEAQLRPARAAGVSLFGILPWLIEGAVLYGIFGVLGAGTISLPEAILLHSCATLLGALSFLPGGIGGHEAVAISLAVWYGADPGQAGAATLLIRASTLWFAVAIGAGCLFVEQRFLSRAAAAESGVPARSARVVSAGPAARIMN